MLDACDVIVIGAGPGGLAAGLEAVRGGAKVLMVEKDDVVGEPVNCAEGVTFRSFTSAITPKPDWILTHLKAGLIVSPSGHHLTASDVDGGLVLDRVKMEQDLAEEFTNAGGTLVCGCRALQAIREGDSFTAVELEEPSGSRKVVEARLIIAGDGVEGTISRLAGLDNRLELDDTETYYQYRLRGIEVDPERIEVHFGSKVAPHSYAWVFPRGENEANVGVGVLCDGTADATVADYLDTFVEKRFPGAEIVYRSCGTSPKYTGPDKLGKRNLLVVGDAARVLDSLTGGGISNAFLSGKIAGQAAALFVSGELETVEEMLRYYPGRFLEQKHAELSQELAMKKAIAKLTDEEIDDLVEVLGEMLKGKQVGQLNPYKLFMGVITKRPRLLKLARHLI